MPGLIQIPRTTSTAGAGKQGKEKAEPVAPGRPCKDYFILSKRCSSYSKWRRASGTGLYFFLKIFVYLNVRESEKIKKGKRGNEGWGEGEREKDKLAHLPPFPQMVTRAQVRLSKSGELRNQFLCPLGYKIPTICTIIYCPTDDAFPKAGIGSRRQTRDQVFQCKMQVFHLHVNH